MTPTAAAARFSNERRDGLSDPDIGASMCLSLIAGKYRSTSKVPQNKPPDAQ
jgi:hypothetical protein